jgi:pimeloyl-ACP methyl ester carboxylesterase
VNQQWIEVGGRRLEAARWGRGGRAPILLLHEGLGSVALWKDFPEALAEASEREVIAWSRQGHGWSAPYEGLRGIDYMHQEAELLPAIQMALGISKAHWFGHSDGGSIALIAASRFPNLALSLILEAPHVFVETITKAKISLAALDFLKSDMGERMKRYHDAPEHLFPDWCRTWLSAEFSGWNIETSAAACRQPTLLIQGMGDQYGTMEQLDRIQRCMPQAIRLELDDCRHSPHFDSRDAVIAATCTFLDGKD